MIEINLKDIRKRKKLTQSEVANFSGISQQYYQMIESDKRKASIKVAKLIAKILGIDWLILRPDIKKEIKTACKQ